MSAGGGGGVAGAGAGGAPSLPTFGQLSQRYIDIRVKNNAKKSDLQRLRIARKTSSRS